MGSLEEHEDVVNWCCFSSDSSHIASSSNDQSLKVTFTKPHGAEILTSIKFLD